MDADGSHEYWEEIAITTSESASGEVDIHNLTGGPPRGADFSSTQCNMRGKRLIFRDEGVAARREGDTGAGSSTEQEHTDTPEPKLQTLVMNGEGCSFRRSGKNEQPTSELRSPPVRLFGRELRPISFAPSLAHSPQGIERWKLYGIDYNGSPDGLTRIDATHRRRDSDELAQSVAARPVSSEMLKFSSGESSSRSSGGPSLTLNVPGNDSDASNPGLDNNRPILSADRLRESINMAYTYLGPGALLPEDTEMDFEIRSSLEGSFYDTDRIPFGAPVEVNLEIEAFQRVTTQRGGMLMKLTRTERKKLSGAEKIHPKRARFLPLAARRRHSSLPSRGSSPSSSSSSRPDSPNGWEQHGRQPPHHEGPLQPPSRSDGREPMESDDAGGEDGDEGGLNTVHGDMEDGEMRMDLTDDLLHKVFSFLDDTALCQAAMVCKQWRVASTHEDFWKSLNFENRSVSHEQVGRLCVRYPKATQLNLRGAPCVDEVLVREAMRSLRNLEVLTLGRGFLSDGFFYALALECAALQHLSITDAVLGNGGAQEIQLRHDSLRRLQIQKCRVLRIAIRCPQLEYLCLKRTGTASAMLHCPRLLTLDVSSCHKLSDAGVRAAATACPLLASLDISNCAYVSDETLREISIACNNLRTLDASYCPNISLEGVRMPMLIDLKLQSCEGIISSSMAALSSCAMLEVLSMDFCLLTAVNLDLPRLRQISLSNNRKFVELTLRSPALVSLNLNHCPFLNRVDITSSSLQSLTLRQQNGLSSMALQCPWLKEVDLTECESLTNAVCDVFSNAGGCPRLSTLTLDSCEGLTEVKLSSSSIQSLSLVGCRNIQSLNLACPVLQNLVLDGCDHLQTASFSPVGLNSLNLGICPHLVKLEVEASHMTHLDLKGCGILTQAAIRCPSLSSLDASYCSQLGDDCLTATTYACPVIQSLVLASCPSVGPVGLLALKRLRNLTTLDLSYTFLTDLSPIFEACPRLQVLRLSACKYLGDNALDALHGGKVLPELRELDLSYGSLGHSAIERVMALCPHLSQVSLNGCAHVTDLLWACLATPPMAGVASRELSGIEDTGMEDVLSSDVSFDHQGQPMDLAQCRDINFNDNAAGIEESGANDSFVINSASGTLLDAEELSSTQMLVSGSDCGASTILEPLEPSAASMESEIVMVRALQSLSCVGCPHIKKVVLPRYASCSQLTSLNLSLSVNIREVLLSCTNLTSLNLSNCAGLVVLELECPRLMSLFLQACGIEARTLELAIQGCVQLETLDVRNCAKVCASSLAQMRAVCPGLKRLYNTMST